jgi:hypothetical protein
MADWRPISTAPLNTVVVTKIDDGKGPRNEGLLKATQRSPEHRVMWWLPDGSMYVYYTPTHWRPNPKDTTP